MNYNLEIKNKLKAILVKYKTYVLNASVKKQRIAKKVIDAIDKEKIEEIEKKLDNV